MTSCPNFSLTEPLKLKIGVPSRAHRVEFHPCSSTWHATPDHPPPPHPLREAHRAVLFFLSLFHPTPHPSIFLFWACKRERLAVRKKAGQMFFSSHFQRHLCEVVKSHAPWKHDVRCCSCLGSERLPKLQLHNHRKKTTTSSGLFIVLFFFIYIYI